MSLHFTEWNVNFNTTLVDHDLAGNDSPLVAFGLKQIAPTLEMFSAMLATGADAAQIWATLYKMTALANLDTLNNPAGPSKLTVPGQFFASDLTQLEGWQQAEVASTNATDGREVTYDLHMFTHDDSVDKTGRAYFSSLQAGAQSFDIDMLSLMAIPGTVQVEILGVPGAVEGDITSGGDDIFNAPAYMQPNAVLVHDATTLDFDMFTGVYTGLDLGAYEIARVEFDMYENPVFGDDRINNITDPTGTDDRIYGKGGDDWIQSGDGRDFVDGGDGHDAIYGGAGSDILIGGNGPDYITGGSGNFTDWIDGGTGADKLFGDGGADRIWGGSGDDEIYGGAGKDKLYGGSGADTIYGGDWHDTISAGSGNDVIFGDGGKDKIMAAATMTSSMVAIGTTRFTATTATT